MQIPTKKLTETAILPTKAHIGDAGFDLYADENVLIHGTILKSGFYNRKIGTKKDQVNTCEIEKKVISTGIAMAIPEGYVGLIWDRSGLSTKCGLHRLAGVIDSTYRGEIKVCLINLSTENYLIQKGDKIAQLLIQPVPMCSLVEVDDLDETSRGDQGFGSSGV